MKAITIYQPWASLIMVGAKRLQDRMAKSEGGPDGGLIRAAAHIELALKEVEHSRARVRA